MRRKSRRTLRGRGFRLLVGALCATVVVAMAASCVVSLLTIGRATQQSSQAIDSAIKAYDLYQQEREPPSSALGDAVADLDAEGDLTALGRDPDNRELRDRVARRIAPLEGVEPDVIDALYVWLQDAADDAAEGDSSGFFLGSEGADIDARTYEERIDLEQLFRLADYGRPVGRLGGDGNTGWNVFVSEYRPGVVIVSFSIMPEVPHLEVLEPIADISEMYFVDPDGTRYAFGRSEYADAIDLSPLSDVQEGSGIVSVEHDGEVYRQYYHNMGRGSHSFVFITPDVAQMAFRQFALVIVATGAVLVVLGCMVGLYLTRRIYEPVQRVIERLAPAGQDVRDEFKLIGFAFDAMENRLTEADGIVAEFHLMRLLRDRASLAEEGAGFFFAEPNREVALAIVRQDEGPGDPQVVERLACLVRSYLEGHGRMYEMCTESCFVFAVVDAHGGGTGALLRGLPAYAKEHGMLVSVFASNVHAGPAKLNLCYREAMRALEEGTKGRVFNKAVQFEAAPDAEDRPRAAMGAREVENMLAYVRDNYRDSSLNATLVAERFGVSRTAVSRAFAQGCPDGFLGYLHGLRLDEAEKLLRTTELPISQIAASVGYGSSLTMTRAFKRYRGTTPGAYRAAAKGGPDEGC